MCPMLNLADADTTGFEPLPSGTYDAVVHEAKWETLKGGPDKKLPAGTPRLSVQFKITEGGEENKGIYNRRVFNGYIVPPQKIDGKKYEHYRMMNGMLVKFFKDLGFDEAEVMSGAFDMEDTSLLIGKEVKVVLGQPKDDATFNPVKSTKPIGDGGNSGGLL